MTKARIAVCIPSLGNPRLGFAMSLAAMSAHTAGAGHELLFLSVQSSILPEARNRLAANAMAQGPDYVLFADNDHTFPPEALVRLLAHDLPAVGVNQARRSDPTGPTASRLLPDGGLEPVWTTEEMAEAGKVEEVAGLGLAFTLIKAPVLEGLDGVLFEFTRAADGTVNGEDFHFFQKVRAAGYGVFVDHALSWEMSHIHERPLTLADTLAQREAYESRLAGR